MTFEKDRNGASSDQQRRVVRIWLGLLLAVVALALCNSALAQRTTGSLRGQVLDPQGAAVANAKVTVTNQATGVVQTTQTTSAGTWNLPSILPGKYTVSVEGPGFKGFVKKDVTVLADQENVADAQLQLGVASETIEVMAGTEQVQTTSSSLNNNFDSQALLSLPVVGGALSSPLNLAILAPNVTAQPGGVTGIGGSVGGTRPRDNNFTVDGVDDNNLGVTGPNSTVIQDAVSEFTLQTNQFSAEYGHSAGGQFNLVTKTGTNAWHGTGEWYTQNRNFNSIDNLTKQAIEAGTISGQPAYDNNRYGGTIGGPLVKDKWFIFGAYERTYLHGQGTPTPLLAPTAGGLSSLIGMAANPTVASILQNYPVAPAQSLDPGTGQPSTTTVNGQNIPIGNLIIISPVGTNEHDAQVNSDYSVGHHQLGARFNFSQATFVFPVNSTQERFNQSQLYRNRKFTINDVWSINSNWVNDLRLQYAYYSLANQNPCSTCPQDVTIVDLGQVTVGPGDNQYQKQNTYSVVDNLSWAHGKHTFKFGGQYMHFIYPQFFLSRSNGDNWYKTMQTLVNDLEPDVRGRTLRNAGSGFFLGTQSAMYGFLQDDIKVTPRLTLNLGLRYEYWTNPVGDETQALNAISSVPGVINFGIPKTDKNNIAPRVGFAFDPTGSGKTAIRAGFGIYYDVKFQNFASITLPPQLQSELDPASACTLTPQPSWCATHTNFLAGGGLPATYIPPATQADARALTTSYIDDTVMPKVLSWSLSVQRELYHNSSLEVRYLGTRGVSLPVQYRRNRTSYFDAGGAVLPTFLNPSSIPATWNANTPTDVGYYNFDSNIYAPFGFAANVTSDPPYGSSTYHGGSISFTQRAFRGLTLNTNYTYAHAIDNSTNEFFTSLLNPRRAEDTNRLVNDRANSDLDVRHKFVLSLIYELPKTTTGNRFLKALLNGYQISPVFLGQSGQPVTIQSAVDSNGNGDTAGDRAVFNPSGTGQVSGDVFPVCELPGGTTYVGTTSFLSADLNGCNANSSAPFGFDPAIGYTPVNPGDRYVIAGAGARSTIGRNSITTPGFGVLNLSVFKNTHISETKYLQLQAQVFNILNHPNYSLSNGNVFSNAGVVTATTTQSYVLPFDPNFLNPKVFSGGIRSITLGVKLFF
ncbi:MAG: hypothetical protein DMG84_14860 [Acidobacteria bacterium]|nr:MAG: hypothetical protein DMG84_14860 [Acidobacteriota bacterium]